VITGGKKRMPQLVKGGKWVYGWCVVGGKNDILIPPEAGSEYGFQAGEMVFITCGSRCSGGFGIARPDKLAGSKLHRRYIGQTKIGVSGNVVLPPDVAVKPGEYLLAVRGSWLALGFVQRGPIIEEALVHDEIQVYLPFNSFGG
jgi:hypothetical protein